jgi:hypothetical protein
MRLVILAAVSIAACARASDRPSSDTAISTAAIAGAAAGGDAGAAAPVIHYTPTSSDLSAAACDHAADADSVAPAGHETAEEFLGLLRTDASASPDARENVRFASLDRILGLVSDSGLTYVDVNTVGDVESAEEGELTTTNTDTIAHVALDSLRARLRSQHGSLYENFQSLAKQLASGESGFGRARYCTLPDGFVVMLGLPDYSLAFRRQSDRLRLTRFAALELAAD